MVTKITPKKTSSKKGLVKTSRKRTTVSRKEKNRTSRRRPMPNKSIRKTFPWWKETPRWVLWVVTGLLAIAYGAYFYFYQLQPYFYRWEYGNTYAGKPVVHGIDISHHQGKINWEHLAKASKEGLGIHFVFIKATEGADWLDSSFCENLRQARMSGLLCGVYHFFNPASSAEHQADFFISQVKLTPNDLPPVLDVERRGSYSADSLRMEVKTWLRKIEDYYGVKPILYASYKFKEQYLNDSLFNTYPFWIAHYYVDSLSYSGEWTFWQHTNRGRLPGIDGYVDMNVYNGDLSSLRRITLQSESLYAGQE